MALAFDWNNNVISVTRTDLLLLQASPEIRQLDLVAFKDEIKAKEADVTGINYKDIHTWNASITVSGTVLAPVLQLINGWTVTFEDGTYRVNLAGANSNVGENTNVNQVSIATQNSAGLVVTGTSGLTTAESDALLSLETDVGILLTAQNLTNAQMEAEHITSRTTGQVILRNTVTLERWEADAWEDEAKSIPYGTNPNVGIEAVGLLISVAWS